MAPVDSVRYFEFEYVKSALESSPLAKRCLDVSSPRLFSAHVLQSIASSHVTVVNPDGIDLAETQTLLTALDVDPQRYECRTEWAGQLPWPDASFGDIWCISVIEHIDMPEDVPAIQDIWRVLRPGGRFVLTIPVSKAAFVEYRDQPMFANRESPEPADETPVFFQRWYDEVQVKERIVGCLPDAEVESQYLCGEKTKGWFLRYLKAREQKGPAVGCLDPYLMSRHFRPFASIDELPGCGILGLCLRKRGAQAMEPVGHGELAR